MFKKRGQVTIFIILAIVIVVAGILLYFFLPSIRTSFQPTNPEQFIESCVFTDFDETLKTISAQGGSLDPEPYLLYRNTKIQYGCYTNEYYRLCVMQQPLLQRSIEELLEKDLNDRAKNCFQELKSDYEQKGYRVQIERNTTYVEFLPKHVRVDLQTRVTLTKDSTQTYEDFDFDQRSGLYELLSIASSILNWEARYGEAETTIYMAYYPQIKIEKNKLGEGSTVYVISNRNTQESFTTVSRSLVLPPGYGTNYV
jgi:hypothetical protein